MNLLKEEKVKRPQEARLWRERYRVRFDRNVAGIILTNVDGRIMDCNEPCARIFGFDSRDEVLAHSAWDFYFDRTDREALIERLLRRGRGNCRAEEVCLRDEGDGRDGKARGTGARESSDSEATQGKRDQASKAAAKTRTRKAKERAANERNLSLCNLIDQGLDGFHLLKRSLNGEQFFPNAIQMVD